MKRALIGGCLICLLFLGWWWAQKLQPKQNGPQVSRAHNTTENGVELPRTANSREKPISEKVQSDSQDVILDKLKTAASARQLEFISKYNPTKLTKGFIEFFELSVDQVTAAERALGNALDSLTQVEESLIEDVETSEGLVTFKIPRFADKGASIKKNLKEELSRALGEELASNMMSNKTCSSLQYIFADFGGFSRVLTLKQNSPDSGSERWELTEQFFSPAAKWAIDAGLAPEVAVGKYFHRFTEIPARFRKIVHEK
jgi:hypothetical protein